MPLPLPQVDSGETAIDDGTQRLTVNLQSDGSLSIGGRPIEMIWLEEVLIEAVELKGDDVEVRIRASRDTPYRHAEAVMLACTRQRIWNVTYAVYRREENAP